ncbi:hypothetical protein LTR95_005304 [Oleoguttula sp. CCFEE 5521]
MALLLIALIQVGERAHHASLLTRATIFLLLTTASLRVLAKSDANNYFINPQQPGAIHDYSTNNVYVLGSVINLQWATNYTGLSLALWQYDNSSIQTLEEKVLAFTSLAWPVDLTGLFDLKDGEGVPF